MSVNAEALPEGALLRWEQVRAHAGRPAAVPAAAREQPDADPESMEVGAPVYLTFKAVLDAVAAAVLLVLTSPLLLLAALLVKLTSRGPVFYSQTRLGKDGRPFAIYKIRSMTHNCEHHSGVRWSTPGDRRVTPVGRFLRLSHLDELPQLWNVLRGEMSLVGPRPERPEFVPQLAEALPRYRDRLRVRPGITGLAQVQLPPDTDLESVRRKLARDLYYVEKVGFWLDLRILLATAGKVAGLPSSLTCKLLTIPRGETVENSYRNLGTEPESVARPQPQPA